MDVALPTRTGREIRLRAVSRPEKHLAILLDRLGLPLPNKLTHVQNVVETFARKIEKPQQIANSHPRTVENGSVRPEFIIRHSAFIIHTVPTRSPRRGAWGGEGSSP